MTDRRYIVDQRSVLAVVIVFAGLLQFVICLLIAVSDFPGEYSFGHHFLSDLGRSKHPSAPFFNNSVIVLGLCLIVFFSNAFRAADSRTFTVSGILSALGLIGIGLTPLDLYFLGHHLFLVLWLGPMLVMVVFSMTLFGKRYASLGAVIGSALIYLIVRYIASAGSHDAPFYQKIVVVMAFVWLAVICYHSVFAAVRQVLGVRFGDDAATRQYIARLKTQGLCSADGRRSGNPYRS